MNEDEFHLWNEKTEPADGDEGQGDFWHHSGETLRTS